MASVFDLHVISRPDYVDINENCRYVRWYDAHLIRRMAEFFHWLREPALCVFVLVCSVSSDTISSCTFPFCQSLCWQIEWRLNRRPPFWAAHNRRMNVRLVDQLDRRIQIAGRLLALYLNQKFE